MQTPRSTCDFVILSLLILLHNAQAYRCYLFNLFLPTIIAAFNSRFFKSFIRKNIFNKLLLP